MIDRRHFVLGSMLVASGAAAFAVKPGLSEKRLTASDLDALMPDVVGPWAAGPAEAIILANPDDLGEASYDAIAARHYRAPNAPDVTILIAYGEAQSYATQLHRPEFCYPASGFAIRAQSRTFLPFDPEPLPAQTLIASRRDRTDEIVYWARIGDSFPQGIWDQRLAIARGAVTSNPQDGMLVRLSTTNQSEGYGRRALEEFALQFVAAQDAAARALLIGRRRANPATDRVLPGKTPQQQSG